MKSNIIPESDTSIWEFKKPVSLGGNFKVQWIRRFIIVLYIHYINILFFFFSFLFYLNTEYKIKNNLIIEKIYHFLI